MANRALEGTVASRIQKFQAKQDASQTRSPTQNENQQAPTKFRRPHTVTNSPAYSQGSHIGGARDTGNVNAASTQISGSIAGAGEDKSLLPETRQKSTTSHTKNESSSGNDLIPSQDRLQRGLNSVPPMTDSENAHERRLSHVRANLRCIDETSRSIPDRHDDETQTSHLRDKGDIYDLQDLLDDAIDEHKMDGMQQSSLKQSPSLRKIASEVEAHIPSPTKRKPRGTHANGSPVSRHRPNHSSRRSWNSVTASPEVRQAEIGLPIGSYRQNADSSRTERSSEAPFPKRAMDPQKFLDAKNRSDVQHLHAIERHKHAADASPQRVRCASPVRDRTAAFEKLANLEESFMRPPNHGTTRSKVKLPWWLEGPQAEKSQYLGQHGMREAIATSSRENEDLLGHRRASSPQIGYKSGPIPLALPQIVSARQRANSSSAQIDDVPEALYGPETGLSRLPSRVHSTRTLPQHSAARNSRNDTRSPAFRWGPFLVERKSASSRALSNAPRESSVEANKGSDALDQVRLESPDDEQRFKYASERRDEIGGKVTDHVEYESHLSGHPDTMAQPDLHSGSQSSTPRRHTISNTNNACNEHRTMPSPAYRDLLKYVGDSGLDLEPSMLLDDHRRSSGAAGKQVTEPDHDARSAASCHGDDPTRYPISQDISTGQIDTSQPFPALSLENHASSPAKTITASPIRGRTASRDFNCRARTNTTMVQNGDPAGSLVRVSRSRSKAGNVRVVVEVRMPKGSPVKACKGGKGGEESFSGNRGAEEVGENDGENVVIITTEEDD